MTGPDDWSWEMRISEESIAIRRRIDEVFSFVADTTNDSKWHTTVIEGRRTSSGPIGLGTTFEGLYDSKRLTLETPTDAENIQRVRAEVVEYEPPRALRVRVDFTDPPRGVGARVLGRSFDLTFRFEELPDGTRVYCGGHFQPTALARPLLLFFTGLMAKRNRYLLGNLKWALDGPNPQSQGPAELVGLDPVGPFDLILVEATKARDAEAADAWSGDVKADFANWRGVVNAFRTPGRTIRFSDRTRSHWPGAACTGL